ncbi:glycoside hydrolase family 10 protein [Spirulina major]|uniref:glycoside hydrolase family 10 protein n=1 Tax=Spirulina major TaxID=270636 RepID=UPI001FEB8B81|nr:family 10 glycosylhydrolase [Spirulina major]
MPQTLMGRALLVLIVLNNTIAVLNVVLRWSFLRRVVLRILPGSLLLMTVPAAAIAQDLSLTVVRDPSNQTQWSGITRRLQALDVAYCVLEGTDLHPQRLPQPANAVMVLANISALNASQGMAIAAWLQQGGRIIATGNTGSLAPEAVKTQLQTLLGATWGFPLTTPTALQLNATLPVPALPLATPLQGAAILPTDGKSRVLAHWQTQRSTPAIVATDQTVFLGWRWGNDQVASVNTDVAWFEALLQQYGRLRSSGFGNGQNCATGSNTITQTVTQTVSQANPPAPPRPTTPPGGRPAATPAPAISAAAPTTAPPSSPQVATMLAAAPASLRAQYHDVTRLFERYESAMIAAESQALTESFQDTVAQIRNKGDRSPAPASPTLQEARDRLTAIVNLIASQSFPQAAAATRQLHSHLWDSFPAEEPIRYPETRAIWLDRGTIVRTHSEADLARIFNRLADAGINTVFFETVNASYPIYPSTVAPEQNPLTQGWDPLAAAVKLAHEHGMELHAWVWIFAAANERHNQLLGQPDNYLGPVLSRNPTWVATDRRGDPFQVNSRKVFFDPAHPEVRAYLLDLIDEIATRYDVDGIQLDYIRYPFQDPNLDQTYGFGLEARRQFSRQTGVDPLTIRPNDPLWSQWTQFRIEQINTFVQSAHTLLQEKHPGTLLSAAVFPMPTRIRLTRLQQNWEAWLQGGYVDLLAPMTYATTTTELQTLTAPVLGHGVRSATLLLPGIRLLQLPMVGTLDQIQYLRDYATGGYALFAAENLSLNLQTALRQTQGRRTRQGSEPIAHRQPFETAVLRYRALEREWQYWAQQEALPADQPLWQDWATRSAQVDQALARLAADPSARHAQQAQRVLREFRARVGQQWQGAAIASPYRRKVWDNHLMGLEHLLRYGIQHNLP